MILGAGDLGIKKGLYEHYHIKILLNISGVPVRFYDRVVFF